MKTYPDLTIATTVHNNAEMSAAMLSSFEANLGHVAEIVVVDDASKEPWLQPKSESPLRAIRNESALGFCKASDLALRAVKTPYALLVDADVLFQSGDFSGGYAEFQQGKWAWMNFRQVNFQGNVQDAFEHPLMPPLVFAAGNQLFFRWQQTHKPPSPKSPASRIAEVEIAHSSCTLVNMEAFHAIGGFDPWYWQCQSDVDISLRFRKMGYRVGVDLGYEVKHDGAGGKSGSAARVIDLYRSRVHLYERAYRSSRFYLRPLLFVRHLIETAFLGTIALFKNEPRLALRLQLLKGALRGYD